MRLNFTTRKPKPRASPFAPLGEPLKDGAAAPAKKNVAAPKELGGPSGPEPTRYGDWERKGICIDF